MVDAFARERLADRAAALDTAMRLLQRGGVQRPQRIRQRGPQHASVDQMGNLQQMMLRDLLRQKPGRLKSTTK